VNVNVEAEAAFGPPKPAARGPMPPAPYRSIAWEIARPRVSSADKNAVQGWRAAVAPAAGDHRRGGFEIGWGVTA
jgi:hypothetical protein